MSMDRLWSSVTKQKEKKSPEGGGRRGCFSSFFTALSSLCMWLWPALITASWPLASAQTSDKPSRWFQSGWGNHPSNTTGNLLADDQDCHTDRSCRTTHLPRVQHWPTHGNKNNTTERDTAQSESDKWPMAVSKDALIHKMQLATFFSTVLLFLYCLYE